MSELKMSGYNTNNCHTMLSLFLAIAIRAINHPYSKMAITHICHFLNAISKKVIDVSELDELGKEIRVTMCQLEMCFPPSFFDKIIPTPIDFNRVGIVLSSNVDSCSFRTVRIFNIISLHFGERGGSKLATLRCYVRSLASRPDCSSNSRTALTRCYCYPQ
jgi:hypothetical protein